MNTDSNHCLITLLSPPHTVRFLVVRYCIAGDCAILLSVRRFAIQQQAIFQQSQEIASHRRVLNMFKNYRRRVTIVCNNNLKWPKSLCVPRQKRRSQWSFGERGQLYLMFRLHHITDVSPKRRILQSSVMKLVVIASNFYLKLCMKRRPQRNVCICSPMHII